MKVWKIIFFYKWVICMFDVNLPGCIDSLRCGPGGPGKTTAKRNDVYMRYRTTCSCPHVG